MSLISFLEEQRNDELESVFESFDTEKVDKIIKTVVSGSEDAGKDSSEQPDTCGTDE
jgi:hypothetical protein